MNRRGPCKEILEEKSFSREYFCLSSRDPRGAQNPSGLHRDIEGRIDKSLSEITVEFKFYLVSSKLKDKWQIDE